MDAGDREGAALVEGGEGDRDEVADGSEEDRRVERYRWGVVGARADTAPS